MPSPSVDPVLAARSRVANLHQRRDCTPDQLTEARRELSAAHVERAIQRALAAAPPITADQRARLAALLSGQCPMSGNTLTAVAPGAYVVDFTGGGERWTCPVVALASYEDESGTVYTDPIVLTDDDGRLGTPSELGYDGPEWRMRLAGGGKR